MCEAIIEWLFGKEETDIEKRKKGDQTNRKDIKKMG